MAAGCALAMLTSLVTTTQYAGLALAGMAAARASRRLLKVQMRMLSTCSLDFSVQFHKTTQVIDVELGIALIKTKLLKGRSLDQTIGWDAGVHVVIPILIRPLRGAAIRPVMDVSKDATR